MVNTQDDMNVKWSRSSHSYFERFAVELEAYTKGGPIPSYGDQDVQYYLELQKERLNRKGLTLQYDFRPRGHFAGGGGPVISWADDKYTNRMECRSCYLTRTITRNGRELYEEGENELFYQTITTAHNGEVVEDERYSCPNCGAVSKVKELQKGCPYCGTFFKMSDLSPKISSYYFVNDIGGTENEVKKEIFKFIMPWFLVSALGFFMVFYLQHGNLFGALLQGILGGALFGGAGGYFGWAFKKLGGIFLQAGKSIGPLINVAGSRTRFVKIMKQHSPEFSYEYFTNKVVSLLKMMIYTDDVSKLPTYVGKPVGNMFEDIIDASYFGAVALKQCRVQGDYVTVVADAYMEDLYEKKGRIRVKNDKFRMQLYKKIDREIDYHFSIKKIQCKGCGNSFDATKQTICPSCGRKYEIEDDDWIVTYVEKR